MLRFCLCKDPGIICGRMKLRSPRPGGFTLVEVTIAIGIISFALLGLIGLLPAGLGALRDSVEQSMNAQIVRRISGDLVVRSFASRTDFSSFSGATLFFDEEAQLLAGSAGARYRAVVAVRDPSLPGVDSPTDKASLSTSLKRLGISISRVDIANAATNTYSIQVSYR